MSRIIDKILIQALSVFAMYYMIHGNTFLVVFYSSIILNALGYYLISTEEISFKMKPQSKKELTAFIIEIAFTLVVMFFPVTIVVLPVIYYDIARSRNYIAAGLGLISILNSISSISSDPKVFLYIILISILSVILCIYTEEKNAIKREYKKLRDDSSEKNTRLRSQNVELIQARDTEIHNAQLSERNRIAREIHDNVGHTLSRAILQMGALLAIHKEEPIHSELEGVRATLDDAMNSIRSSVHDLHDDSIDVKGSILQLADSLNGKYNVHMDIDIGDETPRTIKYAIIGITKEAVSNIIKHSTNSDVDIRLNEHPSMYQLIIYDYNANGKSEKSDTSKLSGSEPGMGLENIRGRVEAVNGKLNITTDNGFKIFVSIPK